MMAVTLPGTGDVLRLRNQYEQGIRVRLIEMPDDPKPIEKGAVGTVRYIDDAGQIHVEWDNGRGLSLIPGVDEFEKVEDYD